MCTDQYFLKNKPFIRRCKSIKNTIRESKEIAKFIPALIAPCVVGIIIMKFANIIGLVKLGVFVIIYTIVYGLSMYFLGMNGEEKQLVMEPIKRILRK